MRKTYLMLILASLPATVMAQLGPEITSWKLNNGEFGSYYNVGNFTPIVTTDSANIKNVWYNSTDVYIRAGGVPDYPTGPFMDGNPSLTEDANYLFRITRNPVQNTGTAVTPGLGHIGVFINGVPMYNYADAMSYNNLGIWNRNAVVAENAGFDCSKGHPAMSHYHHHQNPTGFDDSFSPNSTICDSYPSSGLYEMDSTVHSPIVGYAFDGFPVYGAYAYVNTNGTGGIKRMESSYRMRSITTRTTLPDGTSLSPPQYGPAVSSTYPLGLYKEDFEYVAGLGDLDENNGRFCVTPEYPAGIYCYFATVDENWNSTYPYLIGDHYYGVVATDNFSTPGPGSQGGTNVTLPGSGLTSYTGTLGTEENIWKQKLFIYPNPATDIIRIGYNGTLPDENAVADLLTITGQKLTSTKLNNGGIIDLSGVSSGVYLLTVTMNGVQFTQRCIVSK